MAGGVFRDRFPARGKERKYAEREIDEIYGWQKRRGSAGEDEPVGCADSDDYHDVYPSVVGISVGAGGIDLLLFPYDEQEHFQALSENQHFLQRTYKIRTWFAGLGGKIRYQKSKMSYDHEQRKIYRIFYCPTCKQKIRAPKGKGKIQITCPKCKTEFIRRT